MPCSGPKRSSNAAAPVGAPPAPPPPEGPQASRGGGLLGVWRIIAVRSMGGREFGISGWSQTRQQTEDKTAAAGRTRGVLNATKAANFNNLSLNQSKKSPLYMPISISGCGSKSREGPHGHPAQGPAPLTLQPRAQPPAEVPHLGPGLAVHVAIAIAGAFLPRGPASHKEQAAGKLGVEWRTPPPRAHGKPWKKMLKATRHTNQLSAGPPPPSQAPAAARGGCCPVVAVGSGEGVDLRSGLENGPHPGARS